MLRYCASSHKCSCMGNGCSLRIHALSGLQGGTGQEQVPQYFSRLYIGLCPPDVVAIFKGLIDLSDTYLAQLPSQTLSDQEERQKSLLISLFPGMLNSMG